MEIQTKTKIKLFLLVLIVAIIAISFPKLTGYYANAEGLMKDSSYGPLIYIILMILAILVVPIPASPLAITSGVVFGALRGLIYTLIGAILGALLAFSISRFFFREYFQKHFEDNEIYKKLKGKGNKRIAYFVFITRLMPQVSFDLVSYLAGLTRINFFVFIIATFLGMLPIVFILTFAGALLKPFQIMILFFLMFAFFAYAGYKVIQTRKS